MTSASWNFRVEPGNLRDPRSYGPRFYTLCPVREKFQDESLPLFVRESNEDVLDILTSHVSMTRAIAAKNLTELTGGTVGFSRDGALSMEGVSTVLALRNAYGTPAHDFIDIEAFVDLSYYEAALASLR